MVTLLESQDRKDWTEAMLSFDRSELERFLEMHPEISVLKAEEKELRKNCAWHAFGNESWYPCRTGALFDYKGFHFIEKQGYNVIEPPNATSGDIVAYFLQKVTCSYIRHFGVFQGEKVFSKFPCDDFYIHPVELVPTSFGDNYCFLRKNE